MKPPDWAPFSGFTRTDLIDISHVVLGVRVVCCVHRNRLWVMIDGDVRRAAKSTLKSSTHPAATCKKVDDQLVIEIKQQLFNHP
jgi:hypothetical protein